MPPIKKNFIIQKKVIISSVLAAFSGLALSNAALAQSASTLEQRFQSQDESFLDISQEQLAMEAQGHSYVNPQTNAPSQKVSTGQTIVRHQQQDTYPDAGQVVEPLPSPVVQKKRPDIPKEVENRLYPINPAEIRTIISEMDKRQGAAAVPNSASVGTSSQYEVDMTLGATPPVVRVEKGLGAMVNFVDAQGNPWPISSATNFHAEAATISQVAGHVLSVSANSPYLSGSVGVILEALSTPIQFVIVPANGVRDYRVDLRIPQLGPEAKPMIRSASKPSMGDGNIKDFLYGATPDGATRLKVSGKGAKQSNTRAWQNVDGRLVIRTSAMIISPSWMEREAALDGTSVYSLSSTPVVKVSVDGKESTFYLDGLKPMKNLTRR